ncbi:MAG: aldo/keto reductase, partial [Pseudomonadota bacterium]
GSQNTQEDSFAIMDAALADGINCFDTAELYSIPPSPENQGRSEKIIGEWMKKNGNRDKIILATKVAGRTTNRIGMRDTPANTAIILDAKNITYAIDQSLKRLQTDYVDFYQLHWPDRPLQLFGDDREGFEFQDEDFESFENILHALQTLQDTGKVRYFGVSNETPWGLMRFLQAADQGHGPRMQGIQNCYNLVNRVFEAGLAEIAMHENVGCWAFSPLAAGFLSGKYLAGKMPEGSRKKIFGGRLDRYTYPNADPAIAAYCQIAHQFDLDPSAMALRFITSRPWVDTAIFGATNLTQLETAIASQSIPWNDEIMNALNEVHLHNPNPCP